jgi:hypothetical protein
VLLAIVGLVVLAFGGAYLTLYLLNRDAPPPPSLGRKVEPQFSAALDGVWRTGDCTAYRILGGWLLPARAPLTRLDERGVALRSPLDLTKLEQDGRPLTVKLDLGTQKLRLTVGWTAGTLSFAGRPSGQSVRFALTRKRC